MGRAWIFPDNISTDHMIPGKYLVSQDPNKLAQHVMEGVDPAFPEKVKAGDIIVAGKNFGCGSSREHAPIALKAAGISVIIAKSFARIFYRNAINIGIPLLECPTCLEKIQNSHKLKIDLETGEINNLSTGEEIKAKPLPSSLQEIVSAGGLIPYLRRKK